MARLHRLQCDSYHVQPASPDPYWADGLKSPTLIMGLWVSGLEAAAVQLTLTFAL